MSYENINTVVHSRNPVGKIKVQGVTLYNFFGSSNKYPPVVCRQPLTKSGGLAKGLPIAYVNVRDLFQRFGEEWQAVPDGYDYVAIGSILSVDESVGKLAKTAKTFSDVLSIIHYGAAGNQAGVGEFCSNRTKECTKFCLITAGKGSTPQVAFVRVGRTRLSVYNPELFWDMWDYDFAKYQRKATREGKRLACRPNGTTDIMPKQLQERIESNPDVTFYDYTAVPSRIEYANRTNNYHITLSRKETKANHNWIKSAPWKYNVAVVTTPEIKNRLLDLDPEGDLYVDFDKHDLRIPEADGIGKIGLLAPKGQLRGKDSGFVATDLEHIASLVR